MGSAQRLYLIRHQVVFLPFVAELADLASVRGTEIDFHHYSGDSLPVVAFLSSHEFSQILIDAKSSTHGIHIECP